MLNPFDIEVIITPNANAAVDTRAIVTSPDAPFFWLINSIMNDAIITIGIATDISGRLNTNANDSAANPTSPRPCPIIE